jgi:hypothetical protein
MITSFVLDSGFLELIELLHTIEVIFVICKIIYN